MNAKLEQIQADKARVAAQIEEIKNAFGSYFVSADLQERYESLRDEAKHLIEEEHRKEEALKKAKEIMASFLIQIIENPSWYITGKKVDAGMESLQFKLDTEGDYSWARVSAEYFLADEMHNVHLARLIEFQLGNIGNPTAKFYQNRMRGLINDIRNDESDNAEFRVAELSWVMTKLREELTNRGWVFIAAGEKGDAKK